MPGLPTGTVINNSASIIFDTNAAIVTNQWMNTIDSGAPSSAVDSVTEIPGGLPNQRQINWSGTDDAGGSGVKDFSIFQDQDGGQIVTLLANTTATATSSILQCNHTLRACRVCPI